MLSFYKKYYRTAFDIGLIFITVLLVMWVFSFLYKIAAPVFLSFLVFVIIEPFAKFLNKRKIKKSIATAISILLFIIILLGVLIGAGIIFVQQVSGLIGQLDYYTEMFQVQLGEQIANLKGQLDLLPPDLLEKAEEYTGTIAAKGAEIAKAFLLWLLSSITSFSTFVINFLIGIILAYFLSLEIGTWKKVAAEKTPKTFKIAFHFLRENVLKGIATYLKSQLKLVTITFVFVYICLLLLGVEKAFSISLMAAVFDLLPLLGISTLFIPWIIYLFIVGNTSLALWLAGLLIVVILIRQILEPKITGESLGVSAFTMLAFMIISLSIFGVAGLILSPVLIILIKALYDQGYLQQWIRKPEDY